MYIQSSLFHAFDQWTSSLTSPVRGTPQPLWTICSGAQSPTQWSSSFCSGGAFCASLSAHFLLSYCLTSTFSYLYTLMRCPHSHFFLRLHRPSVWWLLCKFLHASLRLMVMFCMFVNKRRSQFQVHSSGFVIEQALGTVLLQWDSTRWTNLFKIGWVQKLYRAGILKVSSGTALNNRDDENLSFPSISMLGLNSFPWHWNESNVCSVNLL